MSFVVGSRQVRRAVVALAGVALVVLVAWGSVSGPVGVDVRAPALPTLSLPSGSPSPTTASSTQDDSLSKLHKEADEKRSEPHVYWGVWVLKGLLALAALLGLVRLVPWLLLVWRHRAARSADQVVTGVDTGADVLAASMAGDRRSQLELVTTGTPRNGVVAAWSRVEELAAASGAAREPWETSTDFTERLLAQLDLDPDAVDTLAACYREARFSPREPGEEVRERARAALERVHADLGARVAP